MFSLFIDYTKWHYSYAFIRIFRLAQEFLRFFFNLFSVKLFLKSLFSPIFSMSVKDLYSSEIGDMIEAFLGGILTRVLGAIMRSIFIILGLFMCLLTSIVFLCALFVWLLMPIVVIGLLYCLVVISSSIL